MSRYLCSCCKRITKSPTAGSSSSKDANEIILTDLVENPYKIDAKLEEEIEKWEEANLDYTEYENQCLEAYEKVLVLILDQVRRHPQSILEKLKDMELPFLQHAKCSIEELARKRVKLLALHGELGFPSFIGGLDVKQKHAQKSVYEIEADETTMRSKSASSNSSPACVGEEPPALGHDLAIKWAYRLNNLDLTQGGIHIRNSYGEIATTLDDGADIKIKPKWPDYLIDLTFDILKVNRVGRLRRTIKLTKNHLIMIKNGCEITKFYPYQSVTSIEMVDSTSLRIQLSSEKSNVYVTPIASHILQQIKTRVAVRKALDATVFHVDRKVGHALFSSLGYTPESIGKVIQTIGKVNTLETDSVVASFAKDLKNRALSSMQNRSSTELAPTSSSSLSRDADRTLRNIRLSLSVSSNTLSSSLVQDAIPSPLLRSSCHHSSDLPPLRPMHVAYGQDEGGEGKEGEASHVLNPMRLSLTTPSEPPSSFFSSATSEPPVDPFRPTVPVNVAGEREGVGNEASEREFHCSRSSSVTDHAASQSVDSIGIGSSSSSVSALTPRGISTMKKDKSHTVSEPRYMGFTEGTPECAVQTEIRSLVYDRETPEGHTRQLFIDNFIASAVSAGGIADSMTSNPLSMTSNGPPGGTSSSSSAQLSLMADPLLSLRHFVDGMHEYIMLQKGSLLCMMYEQAKQRFLINSSRLSSMNNAEYMRFIDEGSKAAKLSNLSRRKSMSFVKEQVDLSSISEEVLIVVSFLIFSVVEESLYMPLKAHIFDLLPSTAEAETELRRKTKFFLKRNQEQWGVPPELTSPLAWQSAIFELHNLEHHLNPSSQLNALIRTVKAIYAEFKLVVLPSLAQQGKTDVCIGADDLVPIFLFVFVQAELTCPILCKELMWALCHPDQLQGEGGYYLTVFESSIEFVTEEPLESSKFDFSLGQQRISLRLSSTSFDNVSRGSMEALHILFPRPSSPP